MDPKIFTLEEASRFLPRIQQALKDLRRLRKAVESKKVEMDLLEIVGVPKAGVSIGADMSKEMSTLNELAMKFNSHLESLEDMGCQIKDLDQGLVDFYSVREGRLVYLCWKEGEKSIQYWHTLDGGFAGRQLL